MLVRITAVALLAATFTTAAAYAEGDALSDTAVGADAPKSAAAVPVAPPTIEDEVAQLADEVGVSPLALQGAVNTVKVPPKAYLIHEGLIEPPAPPPPPPLTISGSWAALAQCESGGNPRTNTGNGYYGMFQEDRDFWANYGNHAYARPDLAPASEQLAAAQRGMAAQGPGAWPVCSRRIGMRR